MVKKNAKCRSCKMVVSAKSDRLKVHRQKCVVTSELDESETVTSVTSVPKPDSVQLARKLLVMPASSAAIERIFSNFGLIQTKLRNKLEIQKCGKLVFCYQM